MSTSHGVAKTLGASLCLASLMALSAPTASATTTTISCSEIDTGVVSCVLPDGVSQYNTTALLAAAQQSTQTTLTTSTPLVLTAFGGAGRQGDNGGGLYSGGSGGQGGRAQTVTSVADFQGTFGSTLYYYVGQLGGTSAGGRGGSSTLVSGVDLTTNQPCIAGYSSCTTTNLLADGAGGGGGGEGNANGDGGYGGNGGTAVSGQIISLGSQGRDGRAATGTLTRTGQGGFGGGNGDGGSGGRGGSGVSSHAGTDGQDGIGGLGGPTHTSKGPNAGVAWTNNSSLSFGSAGQGGEGEWRVNATNYGGGGGGGGGWGGGGGGGGGGEAVTGGGGGGGGSWASSDTETVQNVPVISNPDSGGNGSVIATFVASTT